MRLTDKTLDTIKELLENTGLFSGFCTLKVKRMENEPSKNEMYGAAVKRFVRKSGDTKKDFDVEGTIYLNARDIEDNDKMLQVIAEEASHLVDPERMRHKDHIYQYLKKRILNIAQNSI